MKGIKTIFIVIGTIIFSVVPIFAEGTAMPPPISDTETEAFVDDTDTIENTEEPSVTDSTESTESGTTESMNQRVIDNITRGGLGDYWTDTADRLSTGNEDVESGFFYKLLMRLSNICKRLFIFVVPLSIAIGAFIRGIAGMKKTWRRTGTAIIITVPLIMIALAYGVPIASSIFYYGKL